MLDIRVLIRNVRIALILGSGQESGVEGVELNLKCQASDEQWKGNSMSVEFFRRKGLGASRASIEEFAEQVANRVNFNPGDNIDEFGHAHR